MSEVKGTGEMGMSPEREKMRPYEYATFDPRPVPEAQAANDAVFAKGPIYGVEVTNPKLAERCAANLDPQHSGGDAMAAAVEAAMTWEVPPEQSTLATIKADIDAVGAMAVLEMRRRGEEITDEAKGRVGLIADADRASAKPWPGRQDLPSKENPWPSTFFSDPRAVAVLSAAASDFKVPLGARVSTMEGYLKEGAMPAMYEKQVDEARNQLIAALESGDMKAELTADGKVAVVVGKHRDAMTVGYSLSPIVVAFNPEFSPNPKVPTHAKYTVAQYKMGLADLMGALKELNAADQAVTEQAKWGGSPGIIGSPQGVSSKLSPEQVAEIVARYVKE
jgi:hypothetical protein